MISIIDRTAESGKAQKWVLRQADNKSNPLAAIDFRITQGLVSFGKERVQLKL